MMNFVHEHKWLVVLMAVSVLVIILGLIYIKIATDYEQREQVKMQKLNNMAKQAAQELMQTVSHADQPIHDIIPESSVEKVKAMNGKIPEAGTEEWCEFMMTKNADTWTLDEQSLFAQKCI